MRQLLVCAGLAAALVSGAAAQTLDGAFRIEVQGDFGSAGGAQAAIASAARGADYTLLSASGSQAVITGGAAMLRALSASPAFTSVVAPNAVAVEKQMLGTVEVRATAGGWSARWIETWQAPGDAPPDLGGAGREGLQADVLGAGGKTLASAMVNDPRLTRYEGVGADGRTLTTRRDFLDADGVAYVRLPATSEPTTLRLTATSLTGAKSVVGEAALAAAKAE